jgi:type I restriction enzyme S subunit
MMTKTRSVTEWHEIPFEDLIVESKDGEWGLGVEAIGHQLAEVIRGTDFADLYSPAKELPLRWIKDHLIERKRLSQGDLILETAGGTATQSTGRSVLLNRRFFDAHSKYPVLCSSFSRHLRLNKTKCCPEFISYLLKALYDSGYMAVYNLQHTGVSRFQFTTFKEKTILKLPPLDYQRRIAAILSAYDSLIENYQRQITLLEAMAREIYREWFVRGRCQYVQTQIGGTKTKLKRFVEMNFGQSPSSEFYNENGDGLPFHQGVGTYGNRFPRYEIFCSVDGKIAEEGDILFSVRAPVGRLNIADRKLIIGRGLASLRHKQGFSSFLFYLLQDTFSKEDIIGNGAIFAAVSKSDLEEFEVPYPDEKLVERFDGLVTRIDGKILTLDKETQLIRQMRDKLLPRLMSGQLEVAM